MMLKTFYVVIMLLGFLLFSDVMPYLLSYLLAILSYTTLHS